MQNGLVERSFFRRWRGVAALVASSIFFAVMAVFVRLAQYEGIHGVQTTLVRFVFGIIVVVSAHVLGIARISIRRPMLLAMRGLTGGLAILFYFLSLSAVSGPGRTSLTNSVLLSNSYFVFAPVFGAILIRERIRPAVIVAVVLALVGIVLVATPEVGSVRMGDIYGIGSGVMAGITLVIIRELRKTESPVPIFLSLCVFGALMAVAAMLWQAPVAPSPAGWGILAVMAVTATAGQISLTYAMRYVPAGEGSLISMTTVIYSSFAGILFFNDPITTKLLIGAALVLGSAAYLAVTYGGDER